MLRPRLHGLGPTLILLFSAACASNEPDETVVFLVRHGQYDEAVAEAERHLAASPDDPRARARAVNARVARLLDQARRAIFAGEVDGGIDLLYRALELDSGNPTVRTWIVKTHRQRAEMWLDTAQDALASDDLEGAVAAFDKALEHVPDHPRAQMGMARGLLTLNYRSGQSKTYYDQGVRDFQELLLPSADRSFGIALDNDPHNDDAQARKGRVTAMRAEERLAKARGLEAEELYFASRNEYRLVLLLVPDNPAAVEGYNRMDREVRARQKLEEAEMRVLRGELSEALPLLYEGERLTQAQDDAFSRMQARIEDARFREMYDEARGYERDLRYRKSVEAYARLLEATEFYEDAIARKATLEEFITIADDLYARALAATSDEAALRHLSEILIVWPHYEDVDERIAAIEARLAAPAGAAAGDGATPRNAPPAGEAQGPDGGEPPSAGGRRGGGRGGRRGREGGDPPTPPADGPPDDDGGDDGGDDGDGEVG